MDGDLPLSDRLLAWREKPWVFVREAFDVDPDPWQDDVLHALANPDLLRLAMKACKGPGKTAVLAWIIWWFLVTRPYAKIGATSITEANIDANLWPELSKWQRRSSFLLATFTWTSTRVSRKTHPENWFAVKRAWPKSGNAEQQADALAGLHADDIMFVLDESGGIPQAVMVTAEAVLATFTQEQKAKGHRAIVIQAGNPTHTTGPLYNACTRERHLWHVVTITGDPDDPKRSSRIAIEWARQQIASYGRDNPWVMVNVLGQFPPASINALLGVEEVDAAMNRHLRSDAYTWAQKRLGVDVARFGTDRTVIFPRQGMAAFRPDVLLAANTVHIAARVIRGYLLWKAELVLVDDTGHWGHGVIDNLTTGGYPAIPVNYAGKATDPRYKNKRTEMWWLGADCIKNGGSLPLIPGMVPELTEPTYTFIGGQVVLEDKDHIKERLGRSPDLADAYMTTFALPDMPGELVQQLAGRHTAKRDGDPYPSSDPEPARDDYNPYEPK